MIIFYKIIFLFEYYADVKNCGSFRSFGVIYIDHHHHHHHFWMYFGIFRGFKDI